MTFKLKTIIGVALIEALLLAVLIWTSLGYLSQSNQAQLRERAQTAASLFASTTKDAVLSYDLATLESFVDEILGNPGMVYARVKSLDAGTLAEGGDEAVLKRSFEPDETIAGVTDGVFDTFALIGEGGEVFGRVELGVETAELQGLLDDAENRMAALAAIEMILVALFSLVLGVFLTRQLDGLRVAAQAVAEGEFDIKVEVRSNDEMGQVAKSFNKMLDHLRDARAQQQRYQEELEQLNEQLEDRVARRTQSLQESNDALEATNLALKEAQAQLLQSEKMASIGQLAAGVAHEINNPMAFVSSNVSSLQSYAQDLFEALDKYQSCSDLLERDERGALVLKQIDDDIDLDYLKDDFGELVNETKEGIERVRQIVKDLKDFSHVDSAQWQRVDLRLGLDTTINIARNEVKHNTEIVREFADIPPCECMPSQLNQVFLNMIINASQAMSSGGILTISTGIEGERVFIEFSDTGCGMEADVVKKIFDPFYTTKPVGTGTGLGLSISFGIISRHKGEIEVDSTPGVGTTFRIWLPVEQNTTSKVLPLDVERAVA